MSERKVLAQYGERRKALVVEKAFVETIKKEFEIDEEIIVQKFDHQWEAYVDINSMIEGVMENLGKKCFQERTKKPKYIACKRTKRKQNIIFCVHSFMKCDKNRYKIHNVTFQSLITRLKLCGNSKCELQ
ncbi:hypothetical protein P5673_026526 [Acropora cervicornis]|uniref:Uncharacterized protein n=1 Tax=Acropora cervicornis TaxID=6130 RepID=A0AAD9UWD7_ACRCE|nr:hypothetical protein P5673_026526 [Acropora cervicornis]